MFEFNKTWMANYKSTEKLATERQYRDVFVNNFNLHFHQPKKDHCDTCFAWKQSTPEEKVKNEANYNTHIQTKELARKIKDEDKLSAARNSTECVACFDLQKVLRCPRRESSAF